MARIRRTQDAEDGLFSPQVGLVRISAMLYDRLKRRVEIRLGKKLHRVTSAYLMEKYWRHSGNGMIIGVSSRVLSMAVLGNDFDIALTVVAIDRIYTTVRLHFPLTGQVNHINAFLTEIITECGLTEQVAIVGGKLEMKFQLGDGDEPKFDPRPIPDRSGRKAYCCARELWGK